MSTIPTELDTIAADDQRRFGGTRRARGVNRQPAF
jgi:hypothetical protein